VVISVLFVTAVQPLHSVQTIGCVPPAFCADFNATAVTPLTTVFTATLTGGIPPFSYSWTFGDGSSQSDNPVTHSFSSPNTYLVTLTGSDSGGQSFTISHDVTELQDLPTSPFVSPSMPSWNSHVKCPASMATIPSIIGTTLNSNGGADLSGAGTTSLVLKHTLDYPCANFGFSVFVEIHNVAVTYGPITTTDCSSISGTDSCDIVGNIADFNTPCGACLPGTVYMQEMRWEVERQWSASGFDSASISAHGLPQRGEHLDVQGFVYWSFLAPPDAVHDYSGWYLELTAWRPAQQAPSNCNLSDFNHDGKVNLIDLTLLAYHYNSVVGGGAYDASFDLNRDSQINLADLSIFGLAYGSIC
jgi:PKD repeat protein